ncbi:PIG-L family deacetylase [Variovorax guangxiensis]|uniref:PIG-L deacetylase family protein n=1 Tax=Variovorax guangxiensis TaxID=1775474 RepID=UPI00285E2EE5|nr:PIG-L family deacetylase [Variovorax guangxiensis]MDR6854506.1 LmbE family N-acetylglucosaminyl deacetylase [Variovorax guangxiensis]
MDAVTVRAIRGEGTCEAAWQAWSGLADLPSITAEALVPPRTRAVVVAPHPDDEVLAVGGLLALLARSGAPVQVIAVTDGTASHRASSVWPVERLARERPLETRLALHRLGVEREVLRLGLPDGEVDRLCDALADRLRGLLNRDDVVFTTWREDGHPDHEATGRASALAAARCGARLVEVPVWAWHWATPGDARLPWHRARRLALDADAAQRKRHAVEAFASQLQPDASTGAGAILPASTVARAARPFEVLFDETPGRFQNQEGAL